MPPLERHREGLRGPLNGADAVTLARATRHIIRQNLGWAFGYNLLLVPLAAAP